jgi:hypothetical protein
MGGRREVGDGVCEEGKGDGGECDFSRKDTIVVECLIHTHFCSSLHLSSVQ